MVVVDLSKQQALDAIEQINFTASLDRPGNTRIHFILEEAKENVSDFLIRNCKRFVNTIK